MHITLLGLSGVKIQSSDCTILLAPPHEKSELKASRMKADIVVLGKPADKINIEPNEEKLFVIDGPGEYESLGVFFYVLAHPAKGDTHSLLTLLTVEGMTIAHLGALDGDVDADQMELFEGCDILILPVGGKDVLDAQKASSLIERIEPRVVIPMHTKHKGVATDYDEVTVFLKEMGAEAQVQDKYKIVKKDLPQETMDIIRLSA